MGAPTIGFCRLPDGSTVAYGELGRGSPLVMLPGWLSTSRRAGATPRPVRPGQAGVGPPVHLVRPARVWTLGSVGVHAVDRQRRATTRGGPRRHRRRSGEPHRLFMGWTGGSDLRRRIPDRATGACCTPPTPGPATFDERGAHEGFKALVRANWGLALIAMAAIFIPNGSRRDRT